MNYSRKVVLIAFFSCLAFVSVAQEGTRGTTEEVIGKVMIVPFEPLMYMSQIDKNIHDETKWNFEQIREHFRRNLDSELKLKLKTITSVISFYIDSVRMATDLDYCYKSRSLSYELINRADKKGKTEKPKNITNGQLTVSMNTDAKFMNTKIDNPTLLADLHRKYKVDYFIFINEIDIIPDMNSYDFATDSYQRQVVVHYTIMDLTQKELAAGIATSSFSSKENNPKKIVAKAFTPIAAYITEQFLAAVRPKTITEPPAKK
jgi:hypothetical protein